MKTVAVVGKPGRPDVAKLAAELRSRLVSRGVDVLLDERVAVSANLPAAGPGEIASKADLVVVLGGDGTMLLAAHLLEGKPVPILGVNVGSLGFMTEVPLAELDAVLDRTVRGDFHVEERSKLHAQLSRDGNVLFDAEVVNDAVIKVGALAKLVDVEAAINGAYLTTYKADGVIVATPTGSTAYVLAAGGPIVYPTMEAIVIAAICPHTLTQRPIVVPGASRVTLDIKDADEVEIFLTIDGYTGVPLKVGDRIELTTSKNRILLVRNPRLDFFSVLRAKLRWGER